MIRARQALADIATALVIGASLSFLLLKWFTE